MLEFTIQHHLSLNTIAHFRTRLFRHSDVKNSSCYCILLTFFKVDRDYEDQETRVVGRIRRNPAKPVPKFNDARRLQLQDRTVFVWGFPRDNVSLDDLIDFFEGNYEQVYWVPFCFSCYFYVMLPLLPVLDLLPLLLLMPHFLFVRKSLFSLSLGLRKGAHM